MDQASLDAQRQNSQEMQDYYNTAVKQVPQSDVYQMVFAKAVAARLREGKPLPAGLHAIQTDTGLKVTVEDGFQKLTAGEWLSKILEIKRLELSLEVPLTVRIPNEEVEALKKHIAASINRLGKTLAKPPAYHAPFEPHADRSAMVGWDPHRE